MAWMCFNSGSTLALSKGKVFTVGNSIINTMIAGASGAITVFLIHFFGNKNTEARYSLVMICNGNLAGLVAVTGYRIFLTLDLTTILNIGLHSQ